MHAYKREKKKWKHGRRLFYLDTAQAKNLGTGLDMREMEEGLIKNTERHQKQT